MTISIAIDMTRLSYEEWTAFVFEHPVTDPAWFWTPEWEYVVGNHTILIQYLTRLFHHPQRLRRAYTLPQLEQGFYFLLGPGAFMSLSLSGGVGLLRDKGIPLYLRMECASSIGALFERLFSDHPMDTACFMWWDLLIYGHFMRKATPMDAQDLQIEQVIFQTLCRILHLDSRACRKSALHGLGHLRHPDAGRVIHEFLQAHPSLDTDLKQYALECRLGIID